MSPGAKLFLVIATAGAALGGLAIIAAKNAKAATKSPEQLPPHDQLPPDVIVPPPGAEQPQGGFPGPATVPLPPIVSTPPVIPLPPFLSPPQTPQGPATVPLPPVFSQGPVVPVSPVLPPLTPATPATPPLPTQAPPVSVLPPTVTVPLPSGPVTVPLPPIFASPPATQPSSAPPAPVTAVPSDIGNMVATLLAAEQHSGWNVTDPSVLAFQAARGLVQDAKFGPKSALLTAQFLGTIPIIRFWPKGSQKAKALTDYRAALIKLANETGDQERAAALRFAAMREQGQSFGVTGGKAAALPLSAQVQLAKVA